MNPLSILSGVVCLQTFADQPNAKGYPEVKHGTVEKLMPWAVERNADGFGVFFAVNETDGRGRTAQNIRRVRTYFTDCDGLSSPALKRLKICELLQTPLPPSAIVETKNGVHAYWYARDGQDLDPEAYKRTNMGLIKRFGGDENVKDIARVLRLPNLHHVKNPAEPFLIDVKYEDTTALYDAAELHAAYPPPKAKPAPRPEAHVPVDAPDIWQDISEDLSHWHPSQGVRHTAILVAAGVALKFNVPQRTCTDTLESIALSWGLPETRVMDISRHVKWAYAQQPATVSALRNLGAPIRKLARPA